MRFVHYAPHHLTAIEDRAQDKRGAERGDKPDGLWFSAGDGQDGWRAWCEMASFALAALTHRTEIVFRPRAKLLRLKGVRAIDSFTAEYGREPAYRKSMPPSSFSYAGYTIDWPRVAKKWDGIIIAPYCYARRLHLGCRWYYGWDCASGCVWRARAVEALRPLSVEQKAAAE